MMLKRILFPAAFVLSLSLKAQDPQFTQIYAAPIFLNPAFAGNLEFDCRKLPLSRIKTNMTYRTQYGGAFNTFYGSLDYREKTGRLGLGASFVHDQLGVGTISNSQANLVASFKIPIDIEWQVHTGVQVGYHFRNLNPGNYIYPEQIGKTRLLDASSANPLQRADASFFDVGAGALVFNDRMYAGVSAGHLTRPNQSFRADSLEDPLEYKFSVHGGYKIMLRKTKGFKKSRKPEKSITPTCHFRYQKPFMQLELGTFINLEPAILGIWYRGLPIFKNPAGGLNQEAICLMAGMKMPTDYGLIRLGVSYDIPVEQNLRALGNTFEISLGYQFIDERCRKRIVYRRIPNPDF